MASLIFTHLQKTDGLTLVHALIKAAAENDLPILFCKGYSFRFNETEFGPISGLKRHHISNCLITGHCAYGVHEYIEGDYQYVTILRDPVTRLVSQYRHGRRESGWKDPMSVYIQRGKLNTNVMTKQLAGVMYKDRLQCQQRHFDTAVYNLKNNYDAFGITERYDDICKRIAALKGWPPLNIGRRNAAMTPPKKRLLDEARELVREYFAYDVELYKIASELSAKLPVPQWRDGRWHYAGNNDMAVGR